LLYRLVAFRSAMPSAGMAFISCRLQGDSRLGVRLAGHASTKNRMPDMTKKRVLALGFDPEGVDAAELGGFAPTVVGAFIESHLDRLRSLGYEVENCLVDQGETAAEVVSRALRAGHCDCVMIGAGLRTAKHLLLFERILNLVHELAPSARICFNTTPADTAAAVQRWI
jgi:hypothetical protein